MTSKGPVVCLVSQPLAVPATGRLAVSVWLRVANARNSRPCVWPSKASSTGATITVVARRLSSNAGQPGDAIRSEWGRYVLPVDDLPLEGLTSLRVAST